MRNFASTLVFCFCYSFLPAQNLKDPTPLHLYLQENFDTTIILHTFSAWSWKPDYQILSIKNNRLYPFTYRTPIGNYSGRDLPKDLALRFSSRIVAFTFLVPDTNTHFIPRAVYWNEIPKVRKTVDSLQLWTLTDDKKIGQGCTNCYVYDSIEYYIWLITKKEIRRLDFYSPEYFEKCCPPSRDRQMAIQLVNLMNTSFH